MSGLWLLCTLALAGIEVEPAPAVGQESLVLVVDAEGAPLPGQTVRVVHRPDLHGQEEQAVGITDGRGRVRWSPSRAGVTQVRAGEEELELAVAWTTPPPGALVLLVLLLLAGILGLGYGLWPPRQPRS